MTARGFAFEVQELSGSTRTAQEAADSVGCQVAQIAKSLVFKDKQTGQPVLVVASGVNRVDLKKSGPPRGWNWGGPMAIGSRKRSDLPLAGCRPPATGIP